MRSFKLLILLCILFQGCGPKEKLFFQDCQVSDTGCDSGLGLIYAIDIENLIEIDLDSLNCFNEGIPLPGSRYSDINGVAFGRRRNDKIVYHPVTITKQGLNFTHHYKRNKNDSLLAQLKNVVQKLGDIGLEKDSSLLFPYTFRFPLNGYKNQIMESPWYSGMAQGMALSLFVRVYKVTGEDEYMYDAKRIFNSFKRLKGEGNLEWLSCVDENNYLWIEEYPRPVPCKTLNGMIFSLFGLYEYWSITKDPEAKKILLGGLSTIRNYLPLFRVKGGISYYCLKHRSQNPDYHFVHMEQLYVLYLMTDDIKFLEMRDLFHEDYQAE